MPEKLKSKNMYC